MMTTRQLRSLADFFRRVRWDTGKIVTAEREQESVCSAASGTPLTAH